MDGGHFKPHDLVETCLDLIGPLNVSDKTKQALVSHVSRDGDLIFSDNSDDDKSEARVGNLLSVIAATREYQMG